MNINILKGLVALLFLLVLGYVAGTLSKHKKDPQPRVVSSGSAEIGGPFQLIDTAGRTVTEQTLLGKPALIYFGYTNCPDVCPIDMNRISMALDILEQESSILENLQPVFITVDPARDTPEQLAAFLAGYHPAFIGLTGSEEQMIRAAKVYKVAYEKILSGEMKGMMNHSSYIYLMDAKGKYVTHFGSGVPPSELAEALADYLD